MRIGSYQFDVTGDIRTNFTHISEGIKKAGNAGIRLLVFPECAVTGYPPHCIKSAANVDFEAVNSIHEQLQALAIKYQMFLVAGTIVRMNARCFNSAMVFFPDGKRDIYRKRALWGWDRENFAEGQDQGIFVADALKVGIRICFEVRFPEYFRELYKERTDLNIILFYDKTDTDDLERYSLIKGHIQTRAVENVCPVLTSNTCSPFQTAPTGLFDQSGKILAEAERGKEGLLIYDLEQHPLNFGERGRKTVSDSLIG